ncbi:MAG: DMT family transporter [Burkholderiales bacterium]
MTDGILLAIGAMLLMGVSDLIYKRAARAGIPTHQLLMVQSLLYTPPVIFYGWWTGTLQFPLASLWGAIAAVFAFTGFYNFAYSLKGGTVSSNATIFRLSFVLTALLGVVVLGEPLTALKVLGWALALTAAWLLLGDGGDQQSAIDPALRRSSLIRVGVATVSVGIANLLYKVGLNAGVTPAAMLVVQAAMVVSMSSLLVFRIDGRIRPLPATYRFASMTSILLAAAFILLMEGLARGQASVLVPIAQMGFVLTAVLGFVFLREPVHARNVLGLVFAVGALVSLAWS